MIDILTPSEFECHKKNHPDIYLLLEDFYKSQDIYQRLDNLIELIETCQKVNDSVPLISSLLNSSISMLKVICNSDDYKECIQQRKSLKKINPTFLPNTSLMHLNSPKNSSRIRFLQDRWISHARGKYLTVSENDQRSDERLKVARLNAEEREALRIFIANDKFWKLQLPTNSNQRLKLTLVDTTNYSAHTHVKGRAIYVCSPTGELFLSSSEIGKFHHSSILNGNPVFSAGTMEIKEGVLTYIDDYSGHYRPTAFHFFRFLKKLKFLNVIIDSTVIVKKMSDNPKQALNIVSGNNLNTIGFLTSHKLLIKQQSVKKLKPVDYYQIIVDKLLHSESADQIFDSFLIVMREYYRGKKDFFTNFEEIDKECRFKKIPTDIYSEDPDRFNLAIDQLKSFVSTSTTLDTTWLEELKISRPSKQFS